MYSRGKTRVCSWQEFARVSLTLSIEYRAPEHRDAMRNKWLVSFADYLDREYSDIYIAARAGRNHPAIGRRVN